MAPNVHIVLKSIVNVVLIVLDILHIETGINECLLFDRRICPCYNTNVIENENHVLLECSLYNDLRNTLFDRAIVSVPNFLNTGWGRNSGRSLIWATPYKNVHVIKIILKTFGSSKPCYFIKLCKNREFWKHVSIKKI